VDGSLQQQTRYPSLIHEVVQEKEAVLLGQYAAELRCFSMELKKKKRREREKERGIQTLSIERIRAQYFGGVRKLRIEEFEDEVPWRSRPIGKKQERHRRRGRNRRGIGGGRSESGIGRSGGIGKSGVGSARGIGL
jgi:hypothetical protein